MAEKFVCVTQQDHIKMVTGSTGTNYTSLQGYPFLVEDETDIAFFKKFPKRYQVYDSSIVQVPKTKSADDELRDFLQGISGLTKKSENAIVFFYESLDNLKADIIAGFELFEKVQISEKQSGLVKATILDPRSVEKPRVLLLDDKQLKKLSKSEQVFLIKSLTAKTVPRLESGRVKLLKKLQGEGDNLSRLLEEYKK